MVQSFLVKFSAKQESGNGARCIGMQRFLSIRRRSPKVLSTAGEAHELLLTSNQDPLGPLIFFLYRHQVAAGCAIIGDRLPVRAGVRAIVTSETAREVVVAKIARMDAPSHLHLRENVAQVYCRNGITLSTSTAFFRI